MAYWLVKSEPGSWSWEDQVAKGVEHWNGVRNYQAANNMKAMKVGDRAFFYHSVSEKKIKGIVSVVKEYYPDHTDESGRFGMVDFKTIGPVKHEVTLKEIKGDGRFDDLALVRQSRLSVVPVSDEHWKALCQLCGVKP